MLISKLKSQVRKSVERLIPEPLCNFGEALVGWGGGTNLSVLLIIDLSSFNFLEILNHFL